MIRLILLTILCIQSADILEVNSKSGQNQKSKDPMKIMYTSLPSGFVNIYELDDQNEDRIISTNFIGGYTAWSSLTEKFAFYYKYDNNKTWSIHTVNRDGTERLRLTHEKNKWDYGPDWSPDGEKIVFAREYKDSLRNTKSEIWVMNADGSNQKQINNLVGGSPNYTRDGRIVYSGISSNNKSEICIANIDGSNITQLTDSNSEEWHPEASPDGKKIAFMSNRDGNFEIYVMNINGTNQTRLTHDSVDNFYPSWSPDGTKLIYSIQTGNERKDRDIYIMDANGSNQKKIISNGSQASWMK